MSVKATKGEAIIVGMHPRMMPNSNLKTTPYASFENYAEMVRLANAIKNVENYYLEGIQKTIEKHAEIMRSEIQETAPYDFTESESWEQGVFGNYHMKDHMVRRDYEDSKLGKGQEVESEASYSGHLEYGTAVHGVQHVFFRPSVERGQKEYKLEVIREMKEAIRGV